MYLEHFQLRSQPFCEHAAATALWQDQRMKEGLARLDFLTAMGELGDDHRTQRRRQVGADQTLPQQAHAAAVRGRLLSSHASALRRTAEAHRHATRRAAATRQGSCL